MNPESFRLSFSALSLKVRASLEWDFAMSVSFSSLRLGVSRQTQSHYHMFAADFFQVLFEFKFSSVNSLFLFSLSLATSFRNAPDVDYTSS